jgi:hypothetical protein
LCYKIFCNLFFDQFSNVFVSENSFSLNFFYNYLKFLYKIFFNLFYFLTIFFRNKNSTPDFVVRVQVAEGDPHDGCLDGGGQADGRGRKSVGRVRVNLGAPEGRVETGQLNIPIKNICQIF